MAQSTFNKLNLRDWLHSGLLFLGGVVATSIGQMLDAWESNGFTGLPFDKVSLLLSFKASFGVTLIYLFKQWKQNSSGQLFKKENDDEVGGSGTEIPQQPPPVH